MSLLSNILGSLTGKEKKETVIYPCPNCESDCGAYPEACAQCKPYKEKLVDALYHVANIDAFYDQYEVVPEGTPSAGTMSCPVCNAPASGAVCEYCGSRIAESNGKIQVKSANDIPNPIIQARDLIYTRRAVIDQYMEAKDSASTSSGLLDTVISALTGMGKEEETSLGSTMTESEIKAMAEKYGVSVKDYLEGLDMGTYLSKTAYDEQKSSSASSTATAAAGVAGLGGIATAMKIGSLLNRPKTVRVYPAGTPQYASRPRMSAARVNRPPVGNPPPPPRQNPVGTGYGATKRKGIDGVPVGTGYGVVSRNDFGNRGPGGLPENRNRVNGGAGGKRGPGGVPVGTGRGVNRPDEKGPEGNKGPGGMPVGTGRGTQRFGNTPVGTGFGARRKGPGGKGRG